MRNNSMAASYVFKQTWKPAVIIVDGRCFIALFWWRVHGEGRTLSPTCIKECYIWLLYGSNAFDCEFGHKWKQNQPRKEQTYYNIVEVLPNFWQNTSKMWRKMCTLDSFWRKICYNNHQNRSKLEKPVMLFKLFKQPNFKTENKQTEQNTVLFVAVCCCFSCWLFQKSAH